MQIPPASHMHKHTYTLTLALARCEGRSRGALSSASKEFARIRPYTPISLCHPLSLCLSRLLCAQGACVLQRVQSSLSCGDIDLGVAAAAATAAVGREPERSHLSRARDVTHIHVPGFCCALVKMRLAARIWRFLLVSAVLCVGEYTEKERRKKKKEELLLWGV